MTLLPLVVAALALTPDPLPDLVVTVDNTRIDRSCRVVIAPDSVIVDADGNGVLHVAADDITVEFAAGSLLRGSPHHNSDNEFEGVGIRIDGHSGVTLRAAAIEGFKAAIHATRADRLVIEQASIARNFREHLRSTVVAEHQSDWLRPHANDANQWLRRYGAAVYVEDSADVTLRSITVRNSQNGLILDRCTNARVYDNDCSFLSGWGLAMWRSSDCVVSRNAFDFCIRGYSHGMYNRGQDSAGILVFEQCSRNAFLENSATHSGDGLFLFAGREALGEVQPPAGAGDKPFDFAGRGCNDNILMGNDFSYAAAHGVECTFSFDNRMLSNRLVANAICGVWAGYSQRTLIHANLIESNGQTGAREGGGVNIEHGLANIIAANQFRSNSAGIKLWDDEDAELLKTPWARANHRGSDRTVIAANIFDGFGRAIDLRDAGTVLLFATDLGDRPLAIEVVGRSTIEKLEVPPPLPAAPVAAEPIGLARPVGARTTLAGRENIIMGEWGPWDHRSSMMRLISRDGGRHTFEIFGDPGLLSLIGLDGSGEVGTIFDEPEPGAAADGDNGGVPRRMVLAIRDGVFGVRPYEFRVIGKGLDHLCRGTLVAAQWNVRFFPWDESTDPRVDLEAWRAAAAGPGAVAVTADNLSASWLDFGSRGPRDIAFLADQRDRLPGPDRFGMIATTRLDVPAGRWRVTTRSDDGVRVVVGGTDGKAVIDNWTHHAAVTDTGYFEQKEPGMIDISVEYFEINGGATFDLTIDPA